MNILIIDGKHCCLLWINWLVAANGKKAPKGVNYLREIRIEIKNKDSISL